MTPDDEEFLTEVHQLLDKRAVPPDSPQYVPLHQLPGDVTGPDAVHLLRRSITRTTPGEAFFLKGLRGSGKTVQLLRLKRDLEADGFAVVMFSAEDYLNMREPLNVVDMLFFLVGAISDRAVEDGLITRADAVDSPGWSRLRDWLTKLPSRIQLSPAVELKLPMLLEAKVSLKAELRRDPSFVAALREFLEGRVSELVSEANDSVRELVATMWAQWPDPDTWKGLVVIVDSLDHNRAVESEKFQQVRRALVNLFDRDYENLRFADCRMIFTLPMYVPVTGGKVVRRVTNVKVADRDRRPVQDGIDALRAILTRRVPGGSLTRIFPDDAAVERLVWASGGHLRLLLMLAMELITQAETLPVDAATVESAIDQVRNGMPERSDDQRLMLDRVARQHDLPLETQEEWNVVATLLDQHFVLGYQNGTPWYDVHPLLRDEIGHGGRS